MPTPNLLPILDAYLARHPNERSSLAPLFELITTAGDAIASRHHAAGHLTASALIVDRTTDRILLIFHRGLQLWLQPGGHIEPGESLRDAALREAREEVGDFPPPSGDHASLVPLDIDIHPIPARPSRGEPAHFHHDFRYLLEVQGSDWVRTNPAEVDAHQWIPLSDILSHSVKTDLVRAVKKIVQVMRPTGT